MGPYVAVLEGVQADQDFCRVAFHLQNYYSKKQCCHYCGVIQWTSRYPAPGEPNDPSDLYTNFNEDQNRGNPSCKIDSCVIVFSCHFWLGMDRSISFRFFTSQDSGLGYIRCYQWSFTTLQCGWLFP